jgi:nucleoside-diphosphate-sugar epimerase
VRVFVAGATGAIGRRLLPLLVADGHQVTGLTSSPARAEQLRAAGAEPVVADALDHDALARAVAAARPEVVIHELTSIPPRINPRRIRRDFVLTDRLRTEGTANLVAAAQANGGARLIAQSIAFSYAPGPAGSVHVEDDPLISEQQAPSAYRRSAGAVRELERLVLDADGVVLRYGYFYGPGTSVSREGSMGADLRRRRLPVVGRGEGVWSFIQIDDAARATVAALTQDSARAYNIVDDEPAPLAEWLPALAEALGAPRPMRVPEFAARPLAGAYGVYLMTRAQGASNNRAKRELAWEPRYASWREGFRAALD